MSPPIFTIGHSTYSLERFTRLLDMHNIEVVCDVRSTPYSRMNPQFNRENLARSLDGQDVQYLFLGRELGARSEDLSCYVNGRVQYDRLAKTELFRSGVDRVTNMGRNFRVALMCAEREPLECHRTLLVARALDSLGLPVRHILSDGQLECHSDLLIRLRQVLHLPDSDLFRSSADMIEDAYRLQGERMAYVRKA